jgi:FkbM family methyltransferase
MLRSTLRHLARLCGVNIVSRRHVGMPFLEHPPKTAFDLVLLHRFPVLENLNFIQVGANDGRRADPIAAYLEPCAWSGLMFEPLAANFAALERRHGKNPRLRLHRAAVDTVAGRRLVYDIDRAAHPSLPDWAYGLGSFSRERELTASQELGLGENAVIAEEIATLAWDDVWRDFGPRRCDLLVLDTEGYDVTLLRAAGLAQRRPCMIHFEHACVPANERLAFYRELIDLGYELATDEPDTTAWLKS